jgi:hypothetical protein
MKIILTVLLLMVATGLLAQNKFSGNIGLNLSSVSSVNSTNPDGILGLSGGFAYKMYMNDLGWFLKPGVGFSQEGYLHQRLNYINIPLVIGFDFTDDFNVNGGFQYGILVGGLNDPSNNFYRSNMSFLIGFEFYPTDRFEVGLRFANGIKNLVKEPDALVINDARTYSIQLYFSFNLNQLKK